MESNALKQIDLFNNYHVFFDIAPILVLGLLLGIISFYVARDKAKEEAFKSGETYKESTKPIRRAIINGLQSSVVCIICFFLLNYFEKSLGYYERLGIASLIAFLGFDKTLDLFKKVVDLIEILRNGKGKKE